MGRRDSYAKPDPGGASTAGALLCGDCGATLSLPVRRIADSRLVDVEGSGTRVPQKTWVPALDLPGRRANGRVWIHPHDLLVFQVVPRGFGCCGYSPSGDEYNLFCLCGAAVGILVDECASAIEVALDPVWAEGAVPPLPGGIEERLARLGRAKVARTTERCFLTTYWKLEHDPSRRTAAALELHLRQRREGLSVELVADGMSGELPMPRLELARAIGLRALPIGDAALTVVHQLLGPDNRVLETWGLVRRGTDVEILRERDGRRDTVVVWDEWLALAWESAVDEWMDSGAG